MGSNSMNTDNHIIFLCESILKIHHHIIPGYVYDFFFKSESYPNFIRNNASIAGVKQHSKKKSLECFEWVSSNKINIIRNTHTSKIKLDQGRWRTKIRSWLKKIKIWNFSHLTCSWYSTSTTVANLQHII